MISELWEFKLKFTTDNAEYDSLWDLKHYICKDLGGYGYKEKTNKLRDDNPIRDKIEGLVNEYFDRPEFEVAIKSYEEREGSLIVSFAILAVVYNGLINYGAFRQSLDYLKQDLSSLNNLLRKDIRVSVDRKFIRKNEDSNEQESHSEVSAVQPIQQTPSSSHSQFNFSFREIILTITIVNLILFFGGTLWSSISINSIEDRYREAVKIVNEAQRELKESEVTLENLKREAKTAEYEVKSMIENHIKNIGNENLKDIEKISTRIRSDLGNLESESKLLLEQSGNLKSTLQEVLALQAESQDLIKKSNEVVEELESANKQIFQSQDIVFGNVISYIWKTSSLMMKFVFSVFLTVQALLLVLFVYLGVSMLRQKFA